MAPGDFARRQKAKEVLPLLAAAGVIDQTDEDIFADVPDFHRRIKAEFLNIAPTQLVRETTPAPEAFKNKAGYRPPFGAQGVCSEFEAGRHLLPGPRAMGNEGIDA